jgi:hypothetical protein
MRDDEVLTRPGGDLALLRQKRREAFLRVKFAGISTDDLMRMCDSDAWEEDCEDIHTELNRRGEGTLQLGLTLRTSTLVPDHTRAFDKFYPALRGGNRHDEQREAIFASLALSGGSDHDEVNQPPRRAWLYSCRRRLGCRSCCDRARPLSRRRTHRPRRENPRPRGNGATYRRRTLRPIRRPVQRDRMQRSFGPQRRASLETSVRIWSGIWTGSRVARKQCALGRSRLFVRKAMRHCGKHASRPGREGAGASGLTFPQDWLNESVEWDVEKSLTLLVELAGVPLKEIALSNEGAD